MLIKLFKKSSTVCSYAAASMIRFFRPFFGPSRCKFAIGCTQFAITQLKTKSFFSACICIIKRLLLCSPLGTLHKKILDLQRTL